MLTKSKKLLNAVKKLYTKVTGGKTTKSNDLPTVINSMAENYVGGGGGTTVVDPYAATTTSAIIHKLTNEHVDINWYNFKVSVDAIIALLESKGVDIDNLLFTDTDIYINLPDGINITLINLYNTSAYPHFYIRDTEIELTYDETDSVRQALTKNKSVIENVNTIIIGESVTYFGVRIVNYTIGDDGLHLYYPITLDEICSILVIVPNE